MLLTRVNQPVQPKVIPTTHCPRIPPNTHMLLCDSAVFSVYCFVNCIYIRINISLLVATRPLWACCAHHGACAGPLTDCCRRQEGCLLHNANHRRSAHDRLPTHANGILTARGWIMLQYTIMWWLCPRRRAACRRATAPPPAPRIKGTRPLHAARWGERPKAARCF